MPHTSTAKIITKTSLRKPAALRKSWTNAVGLLKKKQKGLAAHVKKTRSDWDR